MSKSVLRCTALFRNYALRFIRIPAAHLPGPRPSATHMDGLVDKKGRPASRSAIGGWRAALFIIGVEVAERFVFCGISFNLITYLTGPLGLSTATAAASFNAVGGASAMLTPLGGFLTDAYVGRYAMVVLSSLLYILGLVLLTLFAWIHPSCPSADSTTTPPACPPPPPQSQVALFFAVLYLLAVAQSCHKPSVQALGADQFDGRDPSKSSFFSWWFFGACLGFLSAQLSLGYVQDYVGWAAGFGIPALAMAAALLVFLLGTTSYRQYNKATAPEGGAEEEQLLVSVDNGDDHLLPLPLRNHPNEEPTTALLLPLVPILSTCLLYAAAVSQPFTLFTKQGGTLDRRIGSSGLQVPPAALQSFMTLASMVSVPVYERLLLPIARRSTRNPSLRLTTLQKIGTGMFLVTACMAEAALVEKNRLQVAKDAGLVDDADAVVPMSLWWLVPQYVMLGVSNAMTMVGLQEFFYDQMPGGMRSLGLGLFVTVCGLGGLLSGLMISVIDRVTAGSTSTGESWFSDNLNRAHLDYFYWLLAVLTAVGLVAYLFFASSFVYRKQ